MPEKKIVRVFADGRWEERTFYLFTRVGPGTGPASAVREVPAEVVDAWEAADKAWKEADRIMLAWQMGKGPSDPREN